MMPMILIWTMLSRLLSCMMTWTWTPSYLELIALLAKVSSFACSCGRSHACCRTIMCCTCLSYKHCLLQARSALQDRLLHAILLSCM